MGIQEDGGRRTEDGVETTGDGGRGTGFFRLRSPVFGHFLHCIHECGFNAIEDDCADDDDDEHEAEGIEEVHGVEGASA